MGISVAVYMITYNHEEYIEQAIESVMQQQVEFNIKLFIGDDHSTDNTTFICKRLFNKYPGRIELLLNEHNLGATINAIKTFQSCFKSGAKYVAILEGDDYWTDPFKLQKQVDFLNQNSEYSICFHQTQILENNKIFQQDYVSGEGTKDTYGILDLAARNMIHTPSVVFRNGLIEKFPTWYNNTPIGDYVIHMLNARKGKIKYLPDAMAVYRRHSSGTWSLQAEVYVLENWIKMLNFLITEDFSDNVLTILREQRRENASKLLHHLIEVDPTKFKNMLRDLVMEDHELGQQWLLTNFPNYIASMNNSKSFKLAQKLSYLNTKLSNLWSLKKANK